MSSTGKEGVTIIMKGALPWSVQVTRALPWSVEVKGALPWSVQLNGRYEVAS